MPGATAADMTIGELIVIYLFHADRSYRDKAGVPTGEAETIQQAQRPLRKLYAHTAAAKFGPRSLEAVRDAMVAEGWTRGTINRHVQRIRRMFRWAAGKES